MCLAVCLGFLKVRTIRKKWIEHTCSNPARGAVLARYHLKVLPSTHGPTPMSEGGVTEVIAYAQAPQVQVAQVQVPQGVFQA